MNRGVMLPVYAYPLFENALRAANGWTLEEHADPHRRAVVTLQRGGGRQPRRLDPKGAHGRRDHHAVGGQPDGLLPVPQAVHGQHAGRPGRRLHRVLGRGGPGGRRARGSLGVPARRGRRQRPLVHFAAGRAPSLPRHPPGRARPRWDWPGSASTTWRSWTSTRASRPWCRWRRASSGWRWTTPTRPLTLTGGLTFGGGPGNNYAVARHRPGAWARCVRRRARRRWSPGSAGTPPSTRWASMRRGHREVGDSPSPGATSSPRSMPCRSAAVDEDGDRTGAGRDLHRDLRPRRGPRAGHRGLPHGRGRPGLGQHHRCRHAGATLRRGGHRAPGVLAADGVLVLDD